jgi:hypothetical protein
LHEALVLAETKNELKANLNRVLMFAKFRVEKISKTACQNLEKKKK